MKFVVCYNDHENPLYHKTVQLVAPETWKKSSPFSKDIIHKFVKSYNGWMIKNHNGVHILDMKKVHLAYRESTTITGDVKEEFEYVPIPSDEPLSTDESTVRKTHYIRHGNTFIEVETVAETESKCDDTNNIDNLSNVKSEEGAMKQIDNVGAEATCVDTKKADTLRKNPKQDEYTMTNEVQLPLKEQTKTSLEETANIVLEYREDVIEQLPSIELPVGLGKGEHEQKVNDTQNRGLVKCVRYGCMNAYNPDQDKVFGPCLFHDLPPVFLNMNEMYWACCPTKTVTNFNDLMQVRGCQVAKLCCSDQKKFLNQISFVKNTTAPVQKSIVANNSSRRSPKRNKMNEKIFEPILTKYSGEGILMTCSTVGSDHIEVDSVSQDAKPKANDIKKQQPVNVSTKSKMTPNESLGNNEREVPTQYDSIKTRNATEPLSYQKAKERGIIDLSIFDSKRDTGKKQQKNGSDRAKSIFKMFHKRSKDTNNKQFQLQSSFKNLKTNRSNVQSNDKYCRAVSPRRVLFVDPDHENVIDTNPTHESEQQKVKKVASLVNDDAAHTETNQISVSVVADDVRDVADSIPHANVGGDDEILKNSDHIETQQFVTKECLDPISNDDNYSVTSTTSATILKLKSVLKRFGINNTLYETVIAEMKEKYESDVKSSPDEAPVLVDNHEVNERIKERLGTVLKASLESSVRNDEIKNIEPIGIDSNTTIKVDDTRDCEGTNEVQSTSLNNQREGNHSATTGTSREEDEKMVASTSGQSPHALDMFRTMWGKNIMEDGAEMMKTIMGDKNQKIISSTSTTFSSTDPNKQEKKNKKRNEAEETNESKLFSMFW